MVELGGEEADAETMADAERELGKIHKAVESLEIRTLLSDEYDAREALITIRSGAGGVDAADFAEKLMRMCARGEPGSTTTPSRSSTPPPPRKQISSRPPSPRTRRTPRSRRHPRVGPGQPVRQRGPPPDRFAAVEVVPVLEQTDEIEIPDEEIRTDVYRSGGPGGHASSPADWRSGWPASPPVWSSAARTRRASCRTRPARWCARGQAAGAEEGRGEGAPRGDGGGTSRRSSGNQMRNYVLNPYQIVKDLRTGHDPATRRRLRRRARRLPRAPGGAAGRRRRSRRG